MRWPTALAPLLLVAGAHAAPAPDLSWLSGDWRRCKDGEIVVRLLEAGKQLLRNTSAFNASEAKGLGKQLVRRHDVILAPAPENGL